jgi:hypothetical protein
VEERPESIWRVIRTHRHYHMRPEQDIVLSAEENFIIGCSMGRKPRGAGGHADKECAPELNRSEVGPLVATPKLW